MNNCKKLLCGLLALSMLPVSSFAAFDKVNTYSGQFKDVSKDAWYADTIQSAYELGLMNGRSADAFEPNGFITNAEAAVLAARVHALANDEDTNFGSSEVWWDGASDYLDESDALHPLFEADAPYEGYNFFSSEYGLTDYLAHTLADDLVQSEIDEYLQWGMDSSILYSPNGTKPSSRLFFSLLASCSLDEDELTPINDLKKIPDYLEEMDSYTEVYNESLLRLYNAGVLTGSDKWGSFYFGDTITRAEAAAIIVRLADEAKRKEVSFEDSNNMILEPLDTEFIANLLYEYTYDDWDDSYESRILICDMESITAYLTDDTLALPMAYDMPIDEISEGYYQTSYGYRNVNGEWLVEPKYDRAFAFGEYDFAIAIDKKGYHIIDRSGKILSSYGIVNDYITEDIEILSEKLIRLFAHSYSYDFSFGIYTIDGKEIIPIGAPSFSTYNFDFSDGILWVCNPTEKFRYAAYDEEGTMVIPYQYIYASPFYKGRSVVQTEEGIYQIIDKSGSVLKDNVFENYSFFDWDTKTGNILLARNDSFKRGALDYDGNIVVPFEYDDISLFSFAFIAYKYDDMYSETFFDLSGKKITEEEFYNLMRQEGNPNFAPAEPGPYTTRRNYDEYYSEFAFFDSNNEQVSPYIFRSNPLYIPDLNKYIVQINDAIYFFSV